MDEHVLDRPVWSSLIGVHARFAVGEGGARRFQADISPLGGARDEGAESLADLAQLVLSNGPVVVLQANPIVCPPGVQTSGNAPAVQMVFDDFKLRPQRDEVIERLGEADAPEMVALAGLTKPGPFAARTGLLGEFFGVRQDGQLVAMAGERMKQPGFTEVSGVCTHPDFQGRGFARELCLLLVERIIQRGEIPYLHAYAANKGAIRLYEKIGFRVRKTVHAAQLAGS